MLKRAITQSFKALPVEGWMTTVRFRLEVLPVNFWEIAAVLFFLENMKYIGLKTQVYESATCTDLQTVTLAFKVRVQQTKVVIFNTNTDLCPTTYSVRISNKVLADFTVYN